MLSNTALLFGKDKRREEDHQKSVDALYWEIGRLNEGREDF